MINYNHKFNPVKLASQTSDAFSADAYNSWVQVLRLLANRGFNSYEAEAIVRSKWTRWCRDEFHTGTRKATSSCLASYLDKHEHTPGSKKVNELVLESFPDLVPNEHGVPCRPDRNLMSGTAMLIPAGTPLCCDPSSETYWSM